ncbi:MAG: hypothetical protein ACW96U_09165, partial [Candidatus Heimdallarchaeaceae archaeon]
MTRKVWWKALLVLVIVISSQIQFTQNNSAKKPEFFFELEIELGDAEYSGKIANLITEDLKNIGINSSFVRKIYWIGPPKIPWTSDVLIDEIGKRRLLNPFAYYDENGYWRSYDFPYDFPYDVPNMVESMYKLNELKNLTNINLQISKYKEWQEYALDNILLLLPLIDPTNFVFTWSNLEGLNDIWGISDSLPYMHFEELHENQRTVEELNLHEDFQYYSPFDPLTERIFEDHINTFFMEPILKLSPDKIPTKRGLIYNWEVIDANHLKFNMRDNIFWSPSYDI